MFLNKKEFFKKLKFDSTNKKKILKRLEDKVEKIFQKISPKVENRGEIIKKLDNQSCFWNFYFQKQLLQKKKERKRREIN